MRSRSLLVLPLVVVLALGCEQKAPTDTAPASDPASDPTVVSDVLAAISERLKLVSDYSYQGVAENLANGEKISFTYALRQPRMLRADVKEANTTFLFDGANLAIIDGQNRRVLKQDLSKKDEATLIGALHQMFESYSVEGWRPPMLRPAREALSGRMDKDESGPLWIVRSALDDADLKEVRYYLRPPRADFVKKEFVAKNGEVVASSRVLEDMVDEKTRLRFPLVWEHKDARRHYKVRLEAPQVNTGVAPERFQLEVPEGYAVQEFGKDG